MQLLRPVDLARAPRPRDHRDVVRDRLTRRVRGQEGHEHRDVARGAGSTFSTGMTAMCTGGSVVQNRPLPSLVTSTSVPVSAAAKFTPVTPTSAREELGPQPFTSPGRERLALHGQRRARLRGPSTSRIWGSVLWIAGSDHVRRPLARELHDVLAEVGLDRTHARALERGVEVDLLGRHRLRLHDRAGAARRGRFRRRSRTRRRPTRRGAHARRGR